LHAVCLLTALCAYVEVHAQDPFTNDVMLQGRGVDDFSVALWRMGERGIWICDNKNCCL